MNRMSVSRRNLFGAFLKPLRNRVTAAKVADRVAMIQGRYCLAYQGNFCSACYERCPVPGAMDFGDGLPRVVLSACTGCGICHEVCPAPQNAVLLTPRRPSMNG